MAFQLTHLPLLQPQLIKQPPILSQPRNLRISTKAYNSSSSSSRPYTTVMIVPTGVGASIGGYAGDALPVVRTLATVADCVISHPNVLNAAMLYWPIPNVLYLEGHALDRFAEDSWALKIVHQNKVEMWLDPTSGQSTGRIKRPDSLLRAVNTLVNFSQVNAIAVVGRFPDEDAKDIDDYRQGKGIDLLAGVEAVISHLVVKEFQIPCAHAPAVSPLPLSSSLSPRAAAEEIGYTFLPCVLAGLSRAPQYINRKSGYLGNSCICASDVDSVILPVDAFGGKGALAFARNARNKPLMIAVEENQTVLNDTPDKLGIQSFKVSNYWEAIGVIAAHKAGVDPNSLRRNRIQNIRSNMYSTSYKDNVEQHVPCL